jgi:[acyl-carrier-protein] S-malonyltransferase
MLEHEEVGEDDFDFLLGNSAAQVTTYFAARIFESARDTFYVIGERGSAIKVARDLCPGKMVVLTSRTKSIDIREVRKLCKQHNSHVVIGNYNTDKQIVLSGYPAEAVEEIAEQCVQGGYADRWRSFETKGGAYHSPAMESAEAIFAERVEHISFCYPQLTVIANTTARPLKDEKEAHDELIRALTGEVLWQQSQRYLVKQNTRTFIEVSAEEVLTRMAPKGRKRRRVVKFAIGGAIFAGTTGAAVIGTAIAWNQWRETKKKEKEDTK